MTESEPNIPTTHACPQCGDNVSCGSTLGQPRCWCMDFPHVMPVDCSTRCLCPKCLADAIHQRQQQSQMQQ